ncbi:MAG TPA: acyltransferase domain-containing protein [Gammaproteobacteria bacterium]|nr:acyltransferase domain-containing protein [Gammaproteobacteria bacterium]
MSNDENNFADTDIAIIGMAVRVPGAGNVDEFWHNLKNGIESYTEYTDEQLLERGVLQSMLDNPDYQKIGRPLENMEMFDAPLFGFSPKDASIMDPQHRHFLEVSWEALEHAGYDPAQYNGSIGVFGGSGHNAYMPFNIFTNPDLLKSLGLFLARHTSNDKDFLTTRVSYCLNLQGPSINVQTACSTSLVALHLASQSLLSGECDMALAGGVTIEMPHRVGYLYEEGEIQSRDGHCRAFDENASGTVFGSGAVQVVLKRMEDAVNDGDTIHAVIKGSAVNNDGSNKVSYLAPGIDGQAAAINEALLVADVDADTITYVETHGTGTPVGDPIEIAALNQAYRTQTDRNAYCALGSVKTNIGHLDTAAGGAGLIKIVLSMKNRQLPASLHFTRPNPALDLEDSPFYINGELQDWNVDGGKRRAAINSLGVGGTNAHVILEQAPPQDETHPYDGCHLFCLSARTSSSLEKTTQNLEKFLRQHPGINLSDAAYTLKTGRRGQLFRRIVVADSCNDLLRALSGEKPGCLINQKSNENTQTVCFMFTGQGAQYINMCRGLYQSEAVFKDTLDQCAGLLSQHLSLNILDIIYPDKDKTESATAQLNETQYTQPALFAIEYAMAKLFLSWGVVPGAMIGHSIGEYVAACIAGLFTLEDALKLVCSRGRLMQGLEKGSMLVVPLDEDVVEVYLNDEVSIAGLNAPGLTVVSGNDIAIDVLTDALAQKDIETTRLHTSHAFHSSMMEPILEEFKSLFRDITFGEILIPYISNTSGSWVQSDEVSSADYWANHLRDTVRFADGMRTLMSSSDAVFIECGPGYTLSTFARQNVEKHNGHSIIQSIRHPKQEVDDKSIALEALGRLWLAGVDIEWNLAHGELARRRIPLPTYPFDHQYFWIEPGHGGVDLNPAGALQKQDFENWFYQPCWDSSATITTHTRQAEADPLAICFMNAGNISRDIIEQFKSMGVICYTVVAGENYEMLSELEYAINVQSENDYAAVFKAIEKSSGKDIRYVIHGWSIEEESPEGGMQSIDADMSSGFNSLLYIARYFSTNEPESEIQLTVLTNHAVQVSSEPVTKPVKATMAGPVKAMAQEIANLTCKVIDIDFEAPESWKKAKQLSLVCMDALQTGVDEEIAYRGVRRFIKAYKKLTVKDNENSFSNLKLHGNYLITGGVGGIGYELAQYLVKQYSANLVIFNKTPLPDKSTWDDTDSMDRKTFDRIKKIKSLGSSGCQILSFNVDVCDEASVIAAVKSSISELACINGVFHTAGVVDDKLLALKTLDDARNVLSPKVDGLINIDKALKQTKPDFILLFSSVSSELGLSGQVDYIAANAFLNAYAQYKTDSDGINTIAANWGVWADTGMASQLGDDQNANKVYEDITDHYFYTDKTRLRDGSLEYSALLSTKDHWLIDEHRSKNNVALIPGTAYLEFARSAFEYTSNESKPVRLSDVFFVAPFVIEDGEKKRLNVQLSGHTKHREFVISDEFSGECVRGVVSYCDELIPENIHLDSIIERCNKHRDDLRGTAEHNYLTFGDRWQCMNAINYGKKEAIIELEIKPAYIEELKDYILHPAILDMATGAAQALNPDYDPVRDLYIPVSYSHVTVYGAPVQKMYSHVIYSADEGQGSQTSNFDVVISNEMGEVLVVVNQFVMKRVDPAVLQSLKSTRITPPVPEKTASDRFFDMGLKSGMSTAEGIKAVEMLLSVFSLPQVIVSPLPFIEYKKAAKNLRADDLLNDDVNTESFEGLERPEVSSEFVPPESELELKIAKLWMSALGISEVGVNDDFFELGGHSLLLTQVVSRLKKHISSGISVNSLFENPSISKWAEEVSSSDGEQTEAVPLVVALSRSDYAVKYSQILASM